MENGVQFENKWHPQNQPKKNTAGLIGLVMRLSNGRVRTEQQANTILLIMFVVTLFLSITIFMIDGRSPAGPNGPSSVSGSETLSF